MVTKKHLSIIYFLLGFVLFMFTRRSEIVPFVGVAILIAPIFILRFIRTQPTERGILLTLFGFILSMNIALWSLFKFDDGSFMIFYSLIRSSVLAVVWFLPYMIDRLIYPTFKEKGILSTLTFPIIITAIFLLASLDGPFDGGGGTIAKFSYGFLIFKQAVSLFGIWIYVFVYSWLVSTINYFWENQFHWEKTKKPTVIYTSVLLLILLFGEIKTSPFFSPKSDTVKIAAVVLNPEDGKAVGMEQILNQRITSPFEKTVFRIEKLTRKVAENNAKIVSFQEFAMTINGEDENKLREQYQRIAKENQIYLSITYAYFVNEGKGENIHLLINSNGEILLDYAKRYLLGYGSFGENAVFEKGPEVIQSINTPYGKIGIAICRDLGFPSYMKQAARDNVDIMLGPSYDWPKSMGPSYQFTTVENGFSFVRPTYNGCSYAADYDGNILAQMDSNESEEGIMYVDVPTKGIKTLYPMIGDLLGWICVLAMFVFIGLSLINRNDLNTVKTTSK